MFWQSSLEHLAMWPPRHRCGCQAGLWPRTRRHHLRPLGALARDPTSRFAAALISPRTWREFRIEGDLPRLCSSDRDRQRLPCGRSLLSQPRHVPGLFFYSVHISAGGKKQASHWAWLAPTTRLTSCLMRVDWPAQPYRNLAQRLFKARISQSVSIVLRHWNRPNPLAHRRDQQMPPSSCFPSRQLRTASRIRRSPQYLLVTGGGGGPNGAPATLSGRMIRAHPRTSFPP